MANIDLGNLTRYDGKIKQYTEDKYLSKNTANWQMTEKAGAVTCYPVPDTELEPVIDFMFTETSPLDGDKSPNNPSTITGVDSVKVTKCGKNLCPLTVLSKNQNVITITTSSNGAFVFDGTVRNDTDLYAQVINKDVIQTQWYPVIQKGSTYTVSMLGDAGVYFQIYTSSGSGWGTAKADITTGQTATFTIPADATGFMARFYAVKGTVFSNTSIKIQLELGSTATVFEPYSNADCIVNLNDTYYGGSVNLSTGTVTVTHAMYDIGEVMTYYSAGNAVFFFDAPKTSLAMLPTCESFVYHVKTDVFTDLVDGQFMPHIAPDPTTQTRWIFKASNYSTVEAFETAFTGKKLVYKLATPYTVQLTPTQIKSLFALDKNIPRLNTLYTDADSIQVGYQKHPARTAYELENAILALGGGE